MNVEVTHSPRIRIPRRAASGALPVVLALLCHLVPTAHAAGFDPFMTEPGATAVLEEGPIKVPRLYWRSGESIDGTLIESDGKSLSWKADIFSEPLKVRLSSLVRVEQPLGKVQPPGLAHFSLLLKTGDRLHANITALTPEGLVLESPRHGTLKIPLSAVQTIDRLEGSGVVYTGPTGFAGWQAIASPQQAGNRKDNPWIAGEHGAMTCRTWNRTTRLELPLPEKVIIEVVLTSPYQPMFSFGFSSKRDTTPMIETWQDELVVTDQNLFAPLRTLTKDDHTVALRIYWDRIGKTMRIHDWQGHLAAEFQPVHNEPDAMGLVLRNKGPELTLERLCVRAWDGVTPCPTYDPAITWLRTVDGVSVQGTLTTEAGKLVITSAGGAARTVPLAELASFNAGAPDAAKLKASGQPLPELLISPPVVAGTQPPAATGAPVSTLPTRLRYADGTLLTGSLAEVNGGTAVMRLDGIPEPVLSKTSDMIRLSINEPAPASTPLEKPLAQLDVLHTGNSYLHGFFEGAGDSILRWRAVGGLEPTAINPALKDVEIRRQPTAQAEHQPALFFTADDNVLAGTLKSVDAEGAHISSPVADVTALKNEDLRAVHFNSRTTTAEGFADPGWRILKGTDKEAFVRNGSLVLNDGAIFGHPSFLSGDELTFTLNVPGTWGAVALELFNGEIESRAQAMRLHLINSGTDFWAVMEDSENNSRSSEQLRNLTRKDIQLRLVFDENSMLLFANDLMVLSAPLPAAKRTGSGLVFMPSNMWGNTGRDVRISNLNVRSRPDFLQAPTVPEDVRREALTVPRFRRESPPLHALIAPNGDLLRGKIESATPTSITFQSGTEEVQIPCSRVTAAIWLAKPKPVDSITAAQSGQGDGSDPRVPLGRKNLPLSREPAAVQPPPPSPRDPSFSPSHWFVLQDGSRLALNVERFDREEVIASAPLLGHVRIPLSNLSLLRLAPLPTTPAMQAYSHWQLENAADPVLPETGGESSPLLHNLAPNINLPLLGGGPFNLSSHRGQVVVLDFWATWCGPCVASMPENLKVMAQFDPAKVAFIAVNQGEPEAQVEKFLKARNWQMTVAMDTQQTAGRLYGADTIPHTVIIGPDGMVEWMSSGFTPGGAEKMAGVVRKLIK